MKMKMDWIEIWYVFLAVLFIWLNLCLVGVLLAINNQEVGGEECEDEFDCLDQIPLGYKISALIAPFFDVFLFYI